MLQKIPQQETYLNLDKILLWKMTQTASEVFHKHSYIQLQPIKKPLIKMGRKDIPTFDLGVKIPIKRAELYNEYLTRRITK